MAARQPNRGGLRGGTTMRFATTRLAIGFVLFSGVAAAEGTHPVLLEGPFPAATSADPVVAARSALSSSVPTSKSTELKHGFTTQLSGATRVVRFFQTHHGVPVAFRGAGVVQRADGSTVFAVLRTEDSLPDTTPSLSAADAATRASQLLGLTAKPSDATLGIVPINGVPKLVFVVYPSERVMGLPWAPVILIDAHTGSSLGSWNAAVSLGAAKVYPTNPVASPTLIDVTLPVANGATTLENERVKSLNCIDTKQVKSVSIYGFSINAHVCELLQTATADTNGDYPQAPGTDTDPEDAFSELSMFYHVNRAYAFFQGLGMTDLGTKPLPTISNLRLPDGYQTQDLAKMANPNLPLVPFQNAFFAPANPLFSSIFGLNGAAMWFGQGPVRDYSYDGDVVYHEFTHAVVDHTLQLVGNWHADEQGLVDSPGAMNEALADFFSSAIAGDPKVGEYASKDLAPGLPAIRDLSNTFTCPTNLSGEVHSDSQFWSAGLWTARSKLSAANQAKLDKALFDVMAAAPGGDLGYEDLTALFVTSVKTEIDQATADAFSQELTQRGALPACQRVIEYSGTPISGTDFMLGKALIAPGTSSALGNLPYAPGVLQFHVPVPAATTMTVQFNQANIGSGSGNPFSQGTPFAPQILVRWGDAPLKFTYAPDFVAESDLLTDVALSSGKGNVTVDVPLGATSAYVMIVNKGQMDGGYKVLSFEFSGTPDVPDAGPDAGDGGEVDASDDAGKPSKKSESSDSGCGCRTAADPNGPTALGLAALALGLGSVLRRRASKRRRR